MYLESLRDAKDQLVIIGYDHRHGSNEFARVTAATFASRGFKVLLFSSIVPTPFVPFAVKYYKADFGVMITASHNPKDDNGYKVYGANGAQIKSPVDREISKLIPTIDRVLWDISDYVDSSYEDPLVEIQEAYIRTTVECTTPINLPTFPSIVYTPMHGVGLKFVQKLIATSKLPQLIVVPEQAEPSPDFPTVKYPNPEEGAGTLRLACAKAESVGSRIVFANDPDADRFNFAELQEDGWRIFNGNEIALLLADHLYQHCKENNMPIAVISSLVSSRAIGWMAAKEGFHFEQAETGFKNLAAKAQELTVRGYRVLLTFEEAIGYMVGTNVWDKDGISALLNAYYLVGEIYASGQTLSSKLNSLWDLYGYPVQYNSYYLCLSSPKTVFKAVISKLADSPSFAPYTVAKIENFYPASNMVILTFNSGTWMALRTSGTEPKLKFYSETRAQSADGREQCQAELRALVSHVCNLLVEPERHGLVLQEP